MIRQPQLRVLKRADAYRNSILELADGNNYGAPWFYGWVIVSAWLAGWDAAKGRREDERDAS